MWSTTWTLPEVASGGSCAKPAAGVARTATVVASARNDVLIRVMDAVPLLRVRAKARDDRRALPEARSVGSFPRDSDLERRRPRSALRPARGGTRNPAGRVDGSPGGCP